MNPNVEVNVVDKELNKSDLIQSNVEVNVETNGTPISRQDQYLGSMQVDEDGSRFASSDSCQHVKSGHAK